QIARPNSYFSLDRLPRCRFCFGCNCRLFRVLGGGLGGGRQNLLVRTQHLCCLTFIARDPRAAPDWKFRFRVGCRTYCIRLCSASFPKPASSGVIWPHSIWLCSVA